MPEAQIHYWWVNQGQSHAVETNEGFLFANLVAVDGRKVPGYEAMAELSIGDVVLHYFDGRVQAVSRVDQSPSVAPHPHDPSHEGRYVTVELDPLVGPIKLSDIPLDMRKADAPAGPFTVDGAVQQGYLRPVPPTFVEELVRLFGERFPTGSPLGPRERWWWVFSSNPEKFDHGNALREQNPGDESQWVVTRYRDEILPGDGVFFWETGPSAGILALGTVSGAIYEGPDPGYTKKDTVNWVPYVYDIILSERLPKGVISTDPGLLEFPPIRFPQATNYKLPQDQALRLVDLLGYRSLWDRFAHFARLFYEDDAFFEGDERSYKRAIAQNLESALTAFARVPHPTDSDALSEDQLSRYLEAPTPAEAARVLGVSEKRYRDLLRAQEVFVSRGEVFDEEVRRQTLPAALELPYARREGDWRDQLKRAFGSPNNMTAWQAHDSLLKWMASDTDAAAAAMSALVDGGASPGEAIRGFCSLLPSEAVSGRASRLAVASFVLFGTRPNDLPPFRNALLVSALDLMGQEPLGSALDEGDLYEFFLGFLDQVMSECRERGVPIRDRIDAQGVLWSVVSDTVKPPADWPLDEQQGLLAFRRGTSGVTAGTEDNAMADDALGNLVDRFREETGYPTAHHKKKLEERDALAGALTPEALEEPDPKALHRLASQSYIGPGVMPAFHTTISSEGGPELAGEALAYLLYGEGGDAERLDSVASGVHKVPGMKGAIATKALTIVYPDRWIPVVGVPGPQGKKAMIGHLGLEPLDTEMTLGEEIVQSNERLFQALTPYFDTDTYGMSRFLYWDIEREEVADAPTLEGLAASLFLPEESLAEIVELLEDKKQVIFYGPPGTGKTYVARELAEFLAGSPSRVTKLQFHPSYAYEDFVEGFRPKVENEQPIFRLIDGPLKRAATAAAEGTGTHVLLIDEINRGNIAKIFGELYFLLEYRDEEIELQYSDTPFSLPDNLWIIGTMNTADRTIALLDAALRRRFHFVGFFPDVPPIQGLLERWLEANKPEMSWIAEVVDRANAKLPDKHRAIGPSHFMKSSLDEDLTELVWRHSVLPYIEEQFFGEEDALVGFDLASLRAVEATVEETSDGDPPAHTD